MFRLYAGRNLFIGKIPLYIVFAESFVPYFSGTSKKRTFVSESAIKALNGGASALNIDEDSSFFREYGIVIENCAIRVQTHRQETWRHY